MLNLYQHIAYLVLGHLIDVRWIDIDKGQLQNPENYNSIIVPGLLIDIANIDWDGTLGTATLKLSLVFRLLPQTHLTPTQKLNTAKANETFLDSGINQLELADKLHILLTETQHQIGKKSPLGKGQGGGYNIQRANTQTKTIQSFFVIEQTYKVLVKAEKPTIQTIHKPNLTVH